MRHTAAAGQVHSFRPQPSPLSRGAPDAQRAQAARRGRRAGPPQAEERERQLLARELHHGAIQDILAAGLAIEACLAGLPAGSPAHAGLDHAKRLTATALRRLRSSLQSLREDPDAADEQLPDMLRSLQGRHRAHDLQVSVEVTGAPAPLTAAVRRSLFQMASECVFNAAVHGRARRAVIRLSYGPGAVALCIADDGHGKPKTLRKIIRGQVPGTGGGYHLGLSDIAAQAQEMGWTLRADRSDLGGIAVQVLLPAPAAGGTGSQADGRAAAAAVT
jgi:signal transduction histidine kinase